MDVNKPQRHAATRVGEHSSVNGTTGSWAQHSSITTNQTKKNPAMYARIVVVIIPGDSASSQFRQIRSKANDETRVRQPA